MKALRSQLLKAHHKSEISSRLSGYNQGYGPTLTAKQNYETVRNFPRPFSTRTHFNNLGFSLSDLSLPTAASPLYDFFFLANDMLQPNVLGSEKVVTASISAISLGDTRRPVASNVVRITTITPAAAIDGELAAGLNNTTKIAKEIYSHIQSQTGKSNDQTVL
ncbi:hypothetical protein C8R44DRAFT_754563 [Mycena epipterygia]|nr:hypothetical protein C8R44DRAFT_754563 [Mycena epipterygia]